MGKSGGHPEVFRVFVGEGKGLLGRGGVGGVAQRHQKCIERLTAGISQCQRAQGHLLFSIKFY